MAQMSKAAARPSLGRRDGSNESSLKQHKKAKQESRSCHLVIQQTSAEPSHHHTSALYRITRADSIRYPDPAIDRTLSKDHPQSQQNQLQNITHAFLNSFSFISSIANSNTTTNTIPFPVATNTSLQPCSSLPAPYLSRSSWASPPRQRMPLLFRRHQPLPHWQ